MRTEFVRFLLPMTVFLAGAALEEALPHVLSVGCPVLMAAAILIGSVRTCAEAVVLSVVAGFLADALGSLPLATTASFLVLVSLAVRIVPLAHVLAIAAYPLYQFWLVVWTPLSAGELWGRLLVSLPLAALTVFALRPVLLALEGRLVCDAR